MANKKVEKKKDISQPQRKEIKDPLKEILNGDAKSTRERTRRGEFVIAFPLPKDIREIEIKVADMLAGRPAEGFSTATLANFRAYATLDVVVIEGPDWWEELDSAEQCPDDALITDLYRRYLRFYREMQEGLSKGRRISRKSVGQLQSGNDDETMVDGAFQDIAHG